MRAAIFLALIATAGLVAASGLKKEIITKGDCSVKAKSGDKVSVSVAL